MEVSREALFAEMARQDEASSGKGFWASLLPDAGLSTTPIPTSEDHGPPVDILTYVEAPWGMGAKPYPIQRFVLKMIFGLPLDDQVRDIQTWDRFRETVYGTYTEVEFLEYLNRCDPPRCNVTIEQHNANLGSWRTEVDFRLGRRGSKSSMSRWICSYMLYRLAHLQNPQAYYNFLPETVIGVMVVATGEEQAQKLLAPTIATVERSKYLSKFIAGKPSLGKITLKVGESNDPKERRSTITASAFPCSAKSLLGDANILFLLEEYGHFFSNNSDSNKSDKMVFDALNPTRSDFTNPDTGRAEGMFIIVSTPGVVGGHMHKIEQMILKGDFPNGIMLSIPSYWVNPQLSPENLRSTYKADPQQFDHDYGAEWVDGLTTAFARRQIETLWESFGSGNGLVRRGETAFLGLDLGLSNDGTAIYVVASNPEGMVRVIHEEYHRVDQLCYIADGVVELDIVAMAERVDELWEYYRVEEGLADMWQFAGLRSHLRSDARTRLTQVSVTQVENDHIARHFIALINQRLFVLYGDESQWADRWSLGYELTHLSKRTTQGDPPRLKLVAKGEGNHDDQYSALSRAAWCVHLYFADGTKGMTRSTPESLRRSDRLRERVEAMRGSAAGASRWRR